MKTKIIHGDSIVIMKDMLRKFPLVFADQPFNIGEKYEQFDDNKSEFDFEMFTQDWMLSAWERVADGGVLAIHGSIKLQPIHWRAIIQLGLLKRFETQVIWTYRFGQCGYSNWVDGHCNCLILRKPGERKWYADSILVPSDRATKYNDKRATEGVRSGKRPPGTVWGVPSDGVGWGRVTGNSKERWNNHPNQLPCRYVARIVKAYTQPGNWVLDPFLGSGTTGLVCRHEGRSFVGIDVSRHNVESAARRIETGYYPGEEVEKEIKECKRKSKASKSTDTSAV